MRHPNIYPLWWLLLLLVICHNGQGQYYPDPSDEEDSSSLIDIENDLAVFSEAVARAQEENAALSILIDSVKDYLSHAIPTLESKTLKLENEIIKFGHKQSLIFETLIEQSKTIEKILKDMHITGVEVKPIIVPGEPHSGSDKKKKKKKKKQCKKDPSKCQNQNNPYRSLQVEEGLTIETDLLFGNCYSAVNAMGTYGIYKIRLPFAIDGNLLGVCERPF